jgi:hypothetical protein
MPKITNDNVLDLQAFRFPVGSDALHPQYRHCKVIKTNGDMRTIRAPILGKLIPQMAQYEVHVSELKQLPPLPQ